jgi:RNA polymerase sigma factor (TIGR02999 family)
LDFAVKSETFVSALESSPGEITRLLSSMRRGDRDAESRLMKLVYRELRSRAGRYMRGERPDHTLQPTALVNEAYLRLTHKDRIDWQSRAHFYAVAAGEMRRILVDHARNRAAAKRGGPLERISLDDAAVYCASRPEELLALDDALQQLATWAPRPARVVEMLFFGGLTGAEIAEVLGISARTVKRDWSAARAWLHSQIGGAKT